MGAFAVVALVATFLIALDGLRPRRWEVAPEPRALAEEFSGKARHAVLGALIGTRIVAFEHNRATTDLKARRFRQCLAVLLAAVILAGASVQIGGQPDGSSRGKPSSNPSGPSKNPTPSGQPGRTP